jgi:hypothetical protein
MGPVLDLFASLAMRQSAAMMMVAPAYLDSEINIDHAPKEKPAPREPSGGP